MEEKKTYEALRVERSDHVGEIVLDRPPLNLLDADTTREYLAALDELDRDTDIRVIVLSGAGRGLSGGVDIKFLERFGPVEMRQFLSMFYVETVARVRALSKPIIACVHGYAREGACTLAFACDMVIASDDADFGYPGVPNLAAPPGMHVWHLQKLLGRMRAAELVFTGEPIGAQEAAALGLITRMVPRDRLRDETMALARKIAGMSPLALRTTRELMHRVEDMSFREVPPTALDSVALAFASEDSREARRAYIEKRPPVWKGR